MVWLSGGRRTLSLTLAITINITLTLSLTLTVTVTLTLSLFLTLSLTLTLIGFPEATTNKQRYKLLGNSINARVVEELCRYLLRDQEGPELNSTPLHANRYFYRDLEGPEPESAPIRNQHPTRVWAGLLADKMELEDLIGTKMHQKSVGREEPGQCAKGREEPAEKRRKVSMDHHAPAAQ